MKLAEHSRVGILTVDKVLAQKPAAACSVDARTPVLDALRLMLEGDLGALVVVCDGRVAGMFSERDYLRRVVLGNSGAADATVGDLMSPCAFFATPHQLADECLAVMTERQVGHLPVLEHDQVLGLLSRDTLLHALVAYQESVLAALALDQRILFLQGTYSC